MKNTILLLAALIHFASCGKEPPSNSQPANGQAPIRVRTTKVQRENLALSIKSTGMVGSGTEARPSFKTGGIVAKIYVDEGSAVRAGQLLAILDLTEINAQVQQATEAVNKSQRDLQRAENLHADSVATLENVQDARTGLRVAEENLRMANFNKSYSEMRSPIDGKVAKKLVNQGEVVGPGMPGFFILGNAKSDWHVKTGLSDRDWARVAIGDPATIAFDAFPGKEFAAKITRLADTGNPGSGTFDVELALTEMPPRLAAGLIGSVEIFPKTSTNQTVVPLDALVETKRSLAKVFTIKNNKAVLLPVQIAFLHGDKAVVGSGLENVEMVVTDGAPYLFDGAEVEVVQ